MKNEIDESRHLACIQLENRNAVAYGCRDVAIILRQLKLKKKYIVSMPSIMNEKSCRTDARKQKERQNYKRQNVCDMREHHPPVNAF